MSPEQLARFNEADKKVHKVEDQWHYKYMTAHGFAPLDPTSVGFVRSYRYQNASGRIIQCSTGYSADHWQVVDTGLPQVPGIKSFGYWSDLEPYLRALDTMEAAS